MNDAEINLAIAQIEYPEGVCQNLTSSLTGKTITLIHGVEGRTSADYVNNWADMGPIIERENITVDFWDDKQWMAHNNRDTPFVKARAETPTKAAALCYLKMKGE